MVDVSISIDELIKKLQTNKDDGLSSYEALQRLQNGAPNELIASKKRSILMSFLDQLSDKMILILIGAALISAISSIVLGDSIIDSMIIIAIVLLNAVIGVFQEARAEKAIEALKKLTSPTATVIRDGKEMTLEAKNIVRGDVIIVREGAYVPADARIIESNELYCDESSLTGESTSILKKSCIVDENTPIGDMKNIIFANTIITGGQGKAVVVATGMDTYIGKIAKIIDQSKPPQTPLQKKLEKTGAFLGNCALAVCILIFILGIIQKQPPKDMFLTSVSLAVAAIPEGLPAIVTVVLSLGIQRMAKCGTIIRHLPAVETLGCASVICSDKTGTITQNKMAVCDCVGDEKLLKLFGKLCNDKINPTDKAIFDYSREVDTQGYKHLKTIRFTSDRKIMSVVYYHNGKYLIITKGAPDILNRISFGYEKYLNDIERMSKNALRVIGVAYKYTDTFPSDIEKDLKFIGLYGLLDPPREEVSDAVSICRTAGIKTVMITGDHLDTAISIAKKVGIYNGIAATEKEVLALPQKEQKEFISNASVFARATPKFKVKIVQELQKVGHIVAMTGDGVNDAPALKIADIGCGMGSGTDVAKSSADMVLTDDNFSSIVQAVKGGRIIFQNLRRSIHFLLSCNIGEILTILIAIISGIPSPLNAMQLLWVNLVTDSLPAISLGLEKGDNDIMNESPISKKDELLDKTTTTRIVFEGIYIGLLSIICLIIGKTHYSSDVVGSTMCFAVLSLTQLFHSFNMRSSKTFFASKPFSNTFLLFSLIICSALLSLVITIPTVSKVFGCCQLNIEQWGLVIIISASIIGFVDIIKILTNKKHK